MLRQFGRTATVKVIAPTSKPASFIFISKVPQVSVISSFLMLPIESGRIWEVLPNVLTLPMISLMQQAATCDSFAYTPIMAKSQWHWLALW
jgi:hypothetical protein